MRNKTLSALLQYSNVAGSVQYVTGDNNDNPIIIQRGDKTDWTVVENLSDGWRSLMASDSAQYTDAVSSKIYSAIILHYMLKTKDSANDLIYLLIT